MLRAIFGFSILHFKRSRKRADEYVCMYTAREKDVNGWLLFGKHKDNAITMINSNTKIRRYFTFLNIIHTHRPIKYTRKKKLMSNRNNCNVSCENFERIRKVAVAEKVYKANKSAASSSKQ